MVKNKKNAYKVIGITGGIGSGKSYICNILKNLGFPIYEADVAAKKIMLLEPIKKQIQDTFGEESYIDGQLNRNYLTKVFQNTKELKKLNAIVHPAVAKHFEDYLDNLITSHKLVFKEAAILFESGTWKSCHSIVNIFAPLGIRVQRILMRDSHLTKEQIYQRILQQWDDEWKIKNSHFTIFNDGNLHLYKQIQRMIEFLKKN